MGGRGCLTHLCLHDFFPLERRETAGLLLFALALPRVGLGLGPYLVSCLSAPDESFRAAYSPAKLCAHTHTPQPTPALPGHFLPRRSCAVLVLSSCVHSRGRVVPSPGDSGLCGRMSQGPGVPAPGSKSQMVGQSRVGGVQPCLGSLLPLQGAIE